MRRSGKTYRNLEIFMVNVIVDSTRDAVNHSLHSSFQEEVGKHGSVS